MDIDNVVETDVVETIAETKNAKAGLANVSLGLAKGTGKLIGGSFKATKRLSKMVKQCGEKIAQVRAHTDAEEDPYAQLEESDGEAAGDADVVELKPSAELQPGAEEKTSGRRAARALVAALESDLAAARAELEKIRSRSEGTNTPLISQLKDLQKEKKSLLADLEQAKSQTDELITQKDRLSEQVTTLNSELAAAKDQLNQAHSQTRQGQTELKSQLNALQKKNKSLIADLEKARSKVTETKATNSADAVVETEQQQFDALAIDETVETETTPAKVKVEEVNATIFDSKTEKIIFIKALSDMACKDEKVRIDTARIIGGIRHELSIRFLVAQVATEPSPQVRAECIKALSALDMKQALPAVEGALTDKAGLVRLAAVWSLYRLAGQENGAALTRMFADEDEEVRRRAATCIGWLGKEELAVELVPLLDDSSILVRGAAIEAMGNLSCRQVVWPLIEHLNEPEESVRKAVNSALEIITGKKMSGPFPKDAKSLEHLIARWRQWWQEQYPK